jgi:hypothetical protein
MLIKFVTRIYDSMEHLFSAACYFHLQKMDIRNKQIQKEHLNLKLECISTLLLSYLVIP